MKHKSGEKVRNVSNLTYGTEELSHACWDWPQDEIKNSFSHIHLEKKGHMLNALYRKWPKPYAGILVF